MSSDYNLIHRMEKAAEKVHEEINAEQIKHVTDEYTEERVATLLAKMEEARRFWPIGEYRINV